MSLCKIIQKVEQESVRHNHHWRLDRHTATAVILIVNYRHRTHNQDTRIRMCVCARVVCVRVRRCVCVLWICMCVRVPMYFFIWDTFPTLGRPTMATRKLRDHPAPPTTAPSPPDRAQSSAHDDARARAGSIDNCRSDICTVISAVTLLGTCRM